MHETVEVLASWAPGLHEALVGLGEGDFVILDGTLIPTDRVAADEPYYSQNHKRHGMSVRVIARPDGTSLWFWRATPERTRDLTAVRAHGIIQTCLTRQILVLADRAYQGADSAIRTPITAIATCRSTINSTTATTHVFPLPVNAPSPASSPGNCCGEHAAQPTASEGPWQPCIPS
ncbi:hypothetical protein J2Z21_009291 [Streptomyces griseochromogenes]|uniref:DDE Tnp4 domain-containing protein n=1 Tax=Streptomyces griseochromogenes TaxID=68214 RepID=A0ABS4M9C3_9ACTN|nr:hypothetical protein [Streptomyces griseochromogenes]